MNIFDKSVYNWDNVYHFQRLKAMTVHSKTRKPSCYLKRFFFSCCIEEKQKKNSGNKNGHCFPSSCHGFKRALVEVAWFHFVFSLTLTKLWRKCPMTAGMGSNEPSTLHTQTSCTFSLQLKLNWYLTGGHCSYKLAFASRNETDEKNPSNLKVGGAEEQR